MGRNRRANSAARCCCPSAKAGATREDSREKIDVFVKCIIELGIVEGCQIFAGQVLSAGISNWDM